MAVYYWSAVILGDRNYWLRRDLGCIHRGSEIKMGFKHAGKLSCFMAQRRAGIVKVGHKIGPRVLKNPYLFEEIYDLGIFQLFTARDLS